MRKYQKSQCIEMIKTLEEAHGEIAKFIEKKEIDAASALLGECQEAAISLGNIVETTEGEGTDAVSCLEAYCEMVYRVNEEIVSGENHNPRNVEKRLNKPILKAQSSINALPTKLEAVFLPYKASMWDSLESIWMAADEDPNCDAYVIPIPYYDRNPDGSFAQIHYEAEDYPDYVPVTHYGSFDFEQHQPDMIFIHNPYDEYNYVTSVHPNFYSYNLKKYTNCLVYVPYYATSGKMSEGQAFCPSYMVVDYIVVQSKSMIEQFDEHVPREKFLPLGSPKFDRVIRLCKNPPEPPDEWKKKMEGKRVFFYNTSIGGMLEDTEQWLKKVKYVFDTFKESESACILWRPHPLLQSTFESMRVEYLQSYEELKQYFIGENIGIYDETPDVEASISYCDAYIGDSLTSIVSLFEIVNKPIFILNNSILEEPPKNWWKGSYFFFPPMDSKQTQYAVMQNNKLFYSANNDGSYRFLMNLPGGKEYCCFNQNYTVGDRTYLFPTNAQKILVISDNRIERTIDMQRKGNEYGSFSHIWVIDHYVFIIPRLYPDLVRFDLNSERLEYVRNISPFFWRRGEEESFCGNAIDKRRNIIYFFDQNAENIIEINIQTLEHEIRACGYGKPMVACTLQDINDTRYAWLFPMYGKNVLRWDSTEGKYTEYDLTIDGLESINPYSHEKTEKNYFSAIIPLSDENVVICPNWANKFLLLNIPTREVFEWKPPFKYYTENVNNYFFNWGRGYSMRYGNSEKIRWINSPERIAYDLDLGNNSKEEVRITFSENELFEQYADKFGIYYGMYCLIESNWINLKTIIEKNCSDVGFDEVISKRESARVNSNTEGDSGGNIYDYLSRCLN